MMSIEAKNGSNWTDETLQFFRIKVQNIPEFEDFFGISEDSIEFNAATCEFLSIKLSQLFFQNNINVHVFQSHIVRVLGYSCCYTDESI